MFSCRADFQNISFSEQRKKSVQKVARQFRYRAIPALKGKWDKKVFHYAIGEEAFIAFRLFLIKLMSICCLVNKSSFHRIIQFKFKLLMTKAVKRWAMTSLLVSLNVGVPSCITFFVDHKFARQLKLKFTTTLKFFQWNFLILWELKISKF